jgi:hypothetical protein
MWENDHVDIDVEESSEASGRRCHLVAVAVN